MTWDAGGSNNYRVGAEGAFDLCTASTPTVRLVECRSSDNCCRVEVFNSGEWGTVCDDGWEDSDASVVCSEMGCSGGDGIQNFGGGSGKIWMDNVACSGSEGSLTECGQNGWGIHNCAHSEDAGACCTGISLQTGSCLHGAHIQTPAPTSPSPDQSTILGYATWAQTCDTDTMDQQDALMHQSCRGLYGESARAASEEWWFEHGKSLEMVDSSPPEWIVFTQPLVCSNYNAYSLCLGGYGRNCHNADLDILDSCEDFSSHQCGTSSGRAALCIEPGEVSAFCQNSLFYNGAWYATLDATSKDSTETGCQDSFLALPIGWQVAPHDDDSIAVTAAYPWGTHLLVYADGGQRYTSHADYYSQRGQTREWYCCSDGETALGTSSSGGEFKVNSCARRVLIKSLHSCDGISSQLPLMWGSASYSSCVLEYTLKELRDRRIAGLGPRFRTGGLGQLMAPDTYEVWLCVEGHSCSTAADEWMCWVIDERVASPIERAPEQYVAWGPSSVLELVDPSTSASDTRGRHNTRRPPASRKRGVEKDKGESAASRTKAAKSSSAEEMQPALSAQARKQTLRELKEWWEEGLINEDEYQSAKKQILLSLAKQEI